jgi:hypothetical protein
MKLPEYAPSTSDRVSTREELYQVLQLLGGFDEAQSTEPTSDSDCDLLGCLETEPTVLPGESPDELSASDEQFLMEVETFNSLFEGKGERIN